MTAETVDMASENARISETVRSLMGLRHMTIKQLAAKSGIDEDTLGRRLRCVGKHGWQATEVMHVADVLDADLAVLYNGLPRDLFRRDTLGQGYGQQPAGYRVYPIAMRGTSLPARHANHSDPIAA